MIANEMPRQIQHGKTNTEDILCDRVGIRKREEWRGCRMREGEGRKGSTQQEVGMVGIRRRERAGNIKGPCVWESVPSIAQNVTPNTGLLILSIIRCSLI